MHMTMAFTQCGACINSKRARIPKSQPSLLEQTLFENLSSRCSRLQTLPPDQLQT